MRNEALHALIKKQQAGHKNEPLYMIGMQLLEIADREPESAGLLLQDLTRDGMKLSDAAAMLQKHADGIAKPKHLRCVCITPQIAEGLLRKFYGLPDPAEAPVSAPEPDFLDLSSFL